VFLYLIPREISPLLGKQYVSHSHVHTTELIRENARAQTICTKFDNIAYNDGIGSKVYVCECFISFSRQISNFVAIDAFRGIL